MNDTKEVIKRIYDFPLEDVMGECFAKYAKEIIQERAIPDIRDGLKPVQRRILYAMYLANNISSKPFNKCAATVGDVLGKFHPHGDASVYEAMVRMSAWWKQNAILIDIHGNNGSLDGDPPAAYRYTEARLAKISEELFKDIDKNTVKWAPTFDDRLLEPTVLPVGFPLLLVNGTSGISAGYATDIPPHNLNEIIDATIKRIDSPNCKLETLLGIVKGPDFPTGGLVEGKEGLYNAYKTGKGKITIRSNYEIIKEKGKNKIIINDIPFDVLKSNIIKGIDEIRLDKKIDGIIEVRDESDKNDNIRIVIDLKNNANTSLIINYLLKNTYLQVNYNFNMVAISSKRPKQLGLIQIIDSFIDFRKEVIKNRIIFELNNTEARVHIVEGFIKAIDILDEIIKTIRKSKNKTDAIENIIKEYKFTKLQAEAIVMMQLYKLTNTDVTLLKEELSKLNENITLFKGILEDENKLLKLIKEELKVIKKEYGKERKTIISENVTDIKIDELDLINKDDYIVTVSKNGYVKKMSLKSYNNSKDIVLRNEDYIEGIYKINNIDTILLFTNLGNCLYLPVRIIKESKANVLGEHISNLINITDEDKIIRSMGVKDFNKQNITIFTKKGMVKRIPLNKLKVSRYSKPISIIKLEENDEVLNVCINKGKDVFMISENGYLLIYDSSLIPIRGLKSSGAIGMKLKDDIVVGASVIDEFDEYLTIFTDRNTAKRIKITELPKFTRAKKGTNILKSPKSKKYNIIYTYPSNFKTIFKFINDDLILKSTEITIMDKQSVGSNIKKDINDIYLVKNLKDITLLDTKEENPESPKYKAMTMSDFFDEFKI